ncbi:MAG TPA: hypothetical protein VNB22_21140 [Pyrinomonadaceae bacterium]|jgi:hypothetical protein|nr:hypothetical protein [Pyrinomonadaceae bacterium]
MSIFEDLIEELKEENLLEETVIEFHEKNDSINRQAELNNAKKSQAMNFDDFEKPQTLTLLASNEEAELFQPEYPAEAEIYSAEEITSSEDPILIENADVLISTLEPAVAQKYPEVERTKIFVSEKEYFRKRAMDEVTGLQMVDHVLSGVEREQMKLVPKPYDDLPVKMALHDFLQVAHETNTTEHAQSEFRLMQETENWCSALSHRDKHISIAHLRRHCEKTRPPLSSQALIALARFYRNSPYSESVRSKFELVLTRLFSRENEFDQRELLLSREEMIQQLKELYADWSSIQLYSSDEGDSDILIAVMKFEDFVVEAENTGSFEEMIANDYFNRLRLFKQNCNENFFAPLVTVSAIEANIQIGNRYLDLLNKEKENFNAATLEEKYGFLHDQAISDATGKTFELAELLNERSENPREAAELVEVSVKEQERSRALAPKKPRNKLFAVNKWLLAATILTIVVCFGLYFWAERETQEIKPSLNVKKVNLESSEFKDYIQTARIADETFFGITTASWENMNGEKKQEMLKKLLSIGGEKNYKKVHLINSNGKSVGFASAEKAEVYNQ